MKNHFRLIAANLNRKKRIICCSKSNSTHRIRWTIKKLDDDYKWSIFVYFNDFRKNKEKTRLKFSEGSVTILQKMVNCQEMRTKLTNPQLNKLKSALKNNTGTILRLNKMKNCHINYFYQQDKQQK